MLETSLPVLQSGLGLAVLPALAWVFSENRRIFPWRQVLVGLALQMVIIGFMFKVPASAWIFELLNRMVQILQQATLAGTSFVFGYLGGGPLPFTPSNPSGTFILAFQALPLVLVLSSLTAVLYYWGILPRLVRGFAWVFGRTLGTGGAVGFGISANIFVGMIEAPLFIRPYLARLTRSELFLLMTCGMATIAGTVMALYASILQPVLPDAMGHILIASVISVPAAVSMALIMVPETDPQTGGEVPLEQNAAGAMDALTKGASDGVGLVLNIAALLIVLVALVHLINSVLGMFPAILGEPISLERMLGWIMTPVTWVMGLPADQAATAGRLMGQKTILNELVAYLTLADLPSGALSPRSQVIMIYALCGFANFGSLGIMIGGMAAMVPERRPEIVGLGLKSIISGTLATCLTGAVVGLWLW